MSAALTIDAIKQTVCGFYDVRPADLEGPSRERWAVRPRNMAFYLCARMAGIDQESIAASFNRTNRKSVGLAIAETTADLPINPELRAVVEILRERVRALAPRVPMDAHRPPARPAYRRATESKPRPPADKAKTRTCLKCDAGFESTGPGNRICGRCKKGVDAAARILEGVSC